MSHAEAKSSRGLHLTVLIDTGTLQNDTCHSCNSAVPTGFDKFALQSIEICHSFIKSFDHASWENKRAHPASTSLDSGAVFVQNHTKSYVIYPGTIWYKICFPGSPEHKLKVI